MPSQPVPADHSIVELSAVALSAAIQRRALSCTEVLQAFWGQIDRLNPAVNALVAPMPREPLLAQAAQLDAELAAAGIEKHTVNGLRVTTPEALAIVRKVFQQSNLQLVEALQQNGACAKTLAKQHGGDTAGHGADEIETIGPAVEGGAADFVDGDRQGRHHRELVEGVQADTGGDDG